METESKGGASSRVAAEVLAGLAGEFVDLARTMVEQQAGAGLSVETVLRFAAKAVPGSEHASVSRAGAHASPRTVAATGELAQMLDALQYERGEGPAVQALEQSDVAYTNDLATDDRWPDFAAAASRLGIGSMLSFRLYLTSRERAALTFYATRTNAFDSASVATGAIFAAYASLVLVSEVHRDEAMHLRRALESNREIGMAMGILMARELYTPEQAFERLRDASARLHTRLSDLAAEVVETGQLPIGHDGESVRLEADDLDGGTQADSTSREDGSQDEVGSGRSTT